MQLFMDQLLFFSPAGLIHIFYTSPRLAGYFLFKKVFECTFDLNHVELHWGTTDFKCLQCFLSELGMC